MHDHSDDCQIVHTGICTCTQGIGQPAAQLTRKMLVDEYQRGKEIGWEEGRREGYDRGYQEGQDAAVAKMIALQNRDTVGFPPSIDNNPMTEPLAKLMEVGEGKPQHHRHRAAKGSHEVSATKYARDEFDDVPEYQTHLNKGDYLWVLGLAFGFALIAWSLTWFFELPYPFLWAVGTFVTTYCAIIVKLDYDLRKRNHVHRARR